jgi:simple sugar transport system substrate-binding protein
VAGVAAALVLTTAACSSSGGAQEEGGGAETPRLTIAMISHAPEGDAFFDVIIKGAEEAAAKDNVDFQYSSSGSVRAVDAHPERDRQRGRRHRREHARSRGAVTGRQQGGRRGIPVVVFNAGDRDWQQTGALAFYGEPEVLAGEFAGTN